VCITLPQTLQCQLSIALKECQSYRRRMEGAMSLVESLQKQNADLKQAVESHVAAGHNVCVCVCVCVYVCVRIYPLYNNYPTYNTHTHT